VRKEGYISISERLTRSQELKYPILLEPLSLLLPMSVSSFLLERSVISTMGYSNYVEVLLSSLSSKRKGIGRIMLLADMTQKASF
jgi:hypothetical protein